MCLHEKGKRGLRCLCHYIMSLSPFKLRPEAFWFILILHQRYANFVMLKKVVKEVLFAKWPPYAVFGPLISLQAGKNTEWCNGAV